MGKFISDFSGCDFINSDFVRSISAVPPWDTDQISVEIWEVKATMKDGVVYTLFRSPSFKKEPDQAERRQKAKDYLTDIIAFINGEKK